MSERTRELTLLISGDIAVFIAALFLTLTLRYQALPSGELISLHFWPFFFMSVVWVVGFYIGGLYDKLIAPVRSTMVARLMGTQAANVLFAGVLFLILPFGITPKTNLAIYLVVSVLLLTWWRWYLFPRLAPSDDKRALLIAQGENAIELMEELHNNPSRYPYHIHRFVTDAALKKDPTFAKLKELIVREHIEMVILDSGADTTDALLKALYHQLFETQQFSVHDFVTVYETTFDKMPLATIRYRCLVDVLARRPSHAFYFLKRVSDVVGGALLLLVLVPLLPFIWLGNRIQGGGPLFIAQQRVGQYQHPITIYKLRTMTKNQSASATWVKEDDASGLHVTPVGAVLRKLSIDELPQAISIIKGDMSFIGPRSDIAGMFERLREEVSYYETRTAVKPGLSGWAQTNQRYEKGNISPQSVSETQERLAYDLYYIKHQSLLLDGAILLKTVKAFFVRALSLFERN